MTMTTWKRKPSIGIDAGGTLIKTASLGEGTMEYRKFPSSQPERVAAWIREHGEAEICITGGRAALLQSHLDRKAGEMVEFEATCRGVRYLLDRCGTAMEDFVLTNVGTGTSIHHVQQNKQRRIGGTGVGGGTIMGLSRLLTGETDFDSIVRLAAQGSRERIDLTVGHIYQGAEPPIPGELTASNFGRLAQLPPADSLAREELLASVLGLVGETAATLSVMAAGQCGVSSVVFIGSTFDRNVPLQEVVQRYTKLRGAEPIFLKNGEYSGAIGALLHMDRP